VQKVSLALAGTRPRGSTSEADEELLQELILSENIELKIGLHDNL